MKLCIRTQSARWRPECQSAFIMPNSTLRTLICELLGTIILLNPIYFSSFPLPSDIGLLLSVGIISQQLKLIKLKINGIIS